MGRQTGFDTTYRYNNYMHSSAWRNKANERMKIDKGICCVCGRKATEVHHLTYDHFENERMEDLVSLCHECHEEAEDIYNPAVTPWTDWANGTAKVGEDNFMAAMRIDAEAISKVVFDYLIKVRGADFSSLWKIRQPCEDGRRDYWGSLRKAVEALCRKRYEVNADDRIDIAMRTITNHTISKICIAAIEHNNRNFIQALLHDDAVEAYEENGSRQKAADSYDISVKQLDKLRKDDGSSSGPSLHESVLYYCGLDAAAGIKPLKGLVCLTESDYKMLNMIADYMVQTTGIEYLGG